MIDSWLNAINYGKMVIVVLVDFKKAVDLVDHQIRLPKLKSMAYKMKHSCGLTAIFHTAAGSNK